MFLIDFDLSIFILYIIKFVITIYLFTYLCVIYEILQLSAIL